MNQQPNLRESSFRIRNCGAEDFDELLPLFGELWPDKPINPTALRRAYNGGLTCESQAYVCVVDKTQVVGFGSLTIKNSLWQAGAVGHVDELIVQHEFRGRGIGTQLFSCLEALAKEEDVEEYREGSALANSFFRKSCRLILMHS
jgi:GNAT superfamily N-acetyltransferase